MPLEKKVGLFRKRIEVEINRNRRGLDAISISFKGSHPKTVMEVTNQLAGLFIDKNPKFWGDQAAEPTDIVADELETKRQLLEKSGQNLSEYRHRYMGEVPEQLEADLRILERLQTQLRERQQTLLDEKSRLTMIENQIDSNRKILAENRDTGTAPEEGDTLILELLKAQLNTLESNYADRHPDIIQLKIQIADLETKHQAVGPTSSLESRSNSSGDPSLQLVSHTPNDRIRQRIELKANIKNLGFDIANLNREVMEYQERAERTSERERELTKLRRDYENAQESYNSLLNRKLEAEFAVNLGKKQQGEQFRIVDRAVLPLKPVLTDMRKLFLLSAAAGLGFGAGLIFLLDFMNTSLKRPTDYKFELGLTVLATIPKLLSPKDKILRRLNRGLTAVSLAFAAALTAGFGLITINGVEPMLELVGKYVKI
jgi:polysaccharide chain length determinant protein (PEP-CTERM system associated)